jgi:hypothetical protein
VKEEKMMSSHGRGIVVLQAAIGELILDWSTEPLTEPPEREREREVKAKHKTVLTEQRVEEDKE